MYFGIRITSSDRFREEVQIFCIHAYLQNKIIVIKSLLFAEFLELEIPMKTLKL